jgi:hypothetical protein
MVTKGYQKGVYERVTKGINGESALEIPAAQAKARTNHSTNSLWATSVNRVPFPIRLGSYCFDDISMTWIRTIPLSEADEKLRKAIEAQRSLYPIEYATPVHPDPSGSSAIVGSHSLIPDALYHSFSTFGALMSPDLPLTRRQHEMITTMVSVTNRCKY